MEPRLRAVCDLGVAEAREGGGRHEYDGRVQDLSPGGVRRGLAALGGDPLPDAYDEALVAAQEAGLRAFFGELRLHRRNPMPHLANLDVSGYDREYAPAEVSGPRPGPGTWPRGRQAVDGSVAALDEVAPAIATATLSAARGLAAGLDEDDPVEAAALGRRPGSSRTWSRPPAPATAATAPTARSAGGSAPTGWPCCCRLGRGHRRRPGGDVGPGRRRAGPAAGDARRRLRAGSPRAARCAELVAELQRDHPDADGVLAEAQALTDEVIAWTTERRLVPYSDGDLSGRAGAGVAAVGDGDDGLGRAGRAGHARPGTG